MLCALANSVDTALRRAKTTEHLVLRRCAAPRQLLRILERSAADQDLMQHRRFPSGRELGALSRARKKLIQQPKVWICVWRCHVRKWDRTGRQ